tara:strand:+ start:27678 stop:28301 length:624 start_codon:yes stop_codon:yes gene_type:complete
MASKTKLTGDSSNALFALIARIIECSQQGEPDLINALGLPYDLVHRLENLGPSQILSVTSRYFRDRDPLSIYNIDLEYLQVLTKDEVERGGSRDYRIDEFISLRASKRMLEKFFGMRGSNISTRKTIMEIPALESKSRACTSDETRRIFDSWMATKHLSDIIDRYLLTAKLSQCPLFKVEAFVKTLGNPEDTLINKSQNNNLEASYG